MFETWNVWDFETFEDLEPFEALERLRLWNVGYLVVDGHDFNVRFQILKVFDCVVANTDASRHSLPDELFASFVRAEMLLGDGPMDVETEHRVDISS